MALAYCQSCQTVEGNWREPTLAEMSEHGLEDLIGCPNEMVCCECGEYGTYQGIPEHDDFDMER